MRIEAFAICYNEEKLLPYYLRHYLAFCEKITIYDNQSTDRSREICAQFPKVQVIPYESGNQIRDDIYLQIKNNCWKWSNADWVIIGDIDELVYGPEIKRTLCLTRATAIAPALYNMFSMNFPTTTGQIWEEVTMGLPGGAKLNVFRPGELKEINYDPGCHVANPVGKVINDENTGLKTLHCKYLGKEYYIQRTLMSAGRLSEVNKRYRWGFHYQKPADELSAQFDEMYKQALKVL